MKRRAFISLLGGATVWPLASRLHAAVAVRRIGILMGQLESDPEAREWHAAFVQAFQSLGWTAGVNVRFDTRWGAGSEARYRKDAAELVALSPDVILATNTSTIRALQQATEAIPIVFAGGTDPVGAGLVDGLARPGRNTTGFSGFDFSMCAKWLELLKQVAPSVTQAAVLRDPSSLGQEGQLKAIQAAASSVGVEIIAVDIRSPNEIGRATETFATKPNGGLIAVSSAAVTRHREMIIGLAARHRIPAVYPYRYFVSAGGLIAYGPDRTDVYRRAAGYVDRILKGEKPSALPVQAPTKFELAINLKTAKSLALSIPPTLLALADEVIE
jgi:putative ABC transport system substrate-binding protein